MNTLFFVFLLNLALANPAYAYIGPGVSSILLQLIIGGLAGVAMALKLYWHRWFKPKNKQPQKNNKTKSSDKQDERES